MGPGRARVENPARHVRDGPSETGTVKNVLKLGLRSTKGRSL